jgi:general stress protein 26
MKLTKAETDIIRSQGVARVATVTNAGVPHNVAVCPLLDGGKIYIASEKDAVKVKNIRANPGAAIVFDVYRDSWRGLRGVMLQCSAGLVNEKDFNKIRRKFYAKYPKYSTASPIEPEDSVIIQLIPQKKFSWGFE